MKRSKSQIIGMIRDAFAGVPAPSDDELVHCEQCRLWVERFLGRLPSDWRRIRAADIEYEYAALTAVKPAGWKFLLPAYLTWHLRNYETSGSNTVDHLIYQLTVTETKDAHMLECLRSLSPDQRHAVAELLRFMAAQSHDEHLAKDALKALSSFWE